MVIRKCQKSTHPTSLAVLEYNIVTEIRNIVVKLWMNLLDACNT